MRRIFPTRGSVIVGPNEGGIGVVDKRAKKDPGGLYLRFKWKHGLRNAVRIHRLERWDPIKSEWTTERGGKHSREIKDATMQEGLKAVEALAANRGAQEVWGATDIKFNKLPEGWYESARPVPFIPATYQRVYGKVLTKKPRKV